jgi:hypothetical protein
MDLTDGGGAASHSFGVAGTPATNLRTCDDCGMDLPLNAMYFDRDNKAPGGFKGTCKQCRSEIRKVRTDQEVLDKIAQLDKFTLRMLDNIAMGEGSRVPHVAELYERLVEAFGGSSGVARHALNTYLASKPDSQIRVKVLDILTRLAMKTTDTGAAKIPVELLSDADLQRVIEEKTKTILGIGVKDVELKPVHQPTDECDPPAAHSGATETNGG